MINSVINHFVGIAAPILTAAVLFQCFSFMQTPTQGYGSNNTSHCEAYLVEVIEWLSEAELDLSISEFSAPENGSQPGETDSQEDNRETEDNEAKNLTQIEESLIISLSHSLLFEQQYSLSDPFASVSSPPPRGSADSLLISLG